MTLIDCILNQFERSSKWKGDFSGSASLRIEEENYKSIGKNTLIQEAISLEEEQLLKICWVKGYYHEDIEKVEYPLTHIEAFYQRANRTPKYQLIEQKLQLVLSYYVKLKTPWMRRYTEEEVLPKLNKGGYTQELEELKLLYLCLEGLDQLEAPIFKRVFSKRILKNSKTFEKDLQDKIIRIARRFDEELVDTMENSEVLAQLYIEEYSQELSIKGSLLLKVADKMLDTGVFPYGTVLNTQTIKNSVILDNKHITKLITIENKANYVSEAYEEGTLIIFCHGYFSPLEREFLNKLRVILSEQEVCYLHSGDLDYGGVRIFQYIRRRIFPKLQPYRMDVDTFNQYISYSEAIEPGPLEKLKGIEEPLLLPLIERILETNLVIEQEAFL